MIVLLELVTVLLEYIDLSVIAILLHKYSTYYASIMLNAFRHLLCSYLCQHNRRVPSYVYIYLIQNSQAVKKVCGPQKGYGEKRCEIQGGGQEMAVMVG